MRNFVVAVPIVREEVVAGLDRWRQTFDIWRQAKADTFVVKEARRRRSRVPLTDDKLAQVAKVYRQAVKDGTSIRRWSWCPPSLLPGHATYGLTEEPSLERRTRRRGFAFCSLLRCSPMSGWIDTFIE